MSTFYNPFDPKNNPNAVIKHSTASVSGHTPGYKNVPAVNGKENYTGAANAAAGAGAAGSKRKGYSQEDDDDAPMQEDWFGDEEEPELMDDDEDITGPKRQKSDGAERVECSIDLSVGGDDRWKRPAPVTLDCHSTSFSIQCIEADYQIEQPVKLLFPHLSSTPSHLQPQKQAVIRIFGVNDAGNSVLINVHNFLPYFYVPAWQGINEGDVMAFGEALNNELKDASRADKTLLRFVLKVEPVRRQSIYGYHFGQMGDFLRITVAIPALVATARRICERGITIGRLGQRSFNTYESNLPYVLRYMVDRDIRGGGWIELPSNTWQYCTGKKASHCQVEVDTDHATVIGHEPVGDWLKIAPLRILSFDIECAGRKGFFPEPEIDPVIQIANVVSLQSAPDTPIIKNVFTLGSCASIVGAQVVANKTEEELLMNWLRFFVQADPDIITGYNIVNFDLPYLLDRAKALKLKDFPFLGRIRTSTTTMKNAKFESKAYGIRENKDIKIEGRIQFDLLDIIRREYKLRSYTLNSVCAHFLNQQKEDVHYSIISDLQNGNEETRRRLAVYCLKDAVLPMQLLHKLMLIINYVEMARVTGVPLSYLLTRGQQIKVISQLYRKAKQHHLLIPVRDVKGATVIEPKKAYYTVPIATLDFASLYPSIMMAHNLCYSTLVAPKDLQRLKQEEFCKTPTGDCFVKTAVRRGILPEILTELLTARSQAKKMMKDAKDPFVQAVLNGRQLALKISANSVYGFTGAQVGQLPCLAISSSVTGFGRTMIEHTKAVVEREYTIANGFKHDAEVVYGDTDSVMVRFGVDNVKDAMELGAKAAARVTQEFIQPIKLEFEKVYFPYLLMNKKRYAGLYWSNPEKWDKMDTKGIETVRRDTCALVSNVVTECLNLILIERDAMKALEYTKSTIADLLCNRLDLSLLVISKSLGKSASSDDYSNKQAHVELAERMRKRDPRSAPVVGDRVAYVITKGAKNQPAYERAEDPIYVLEHDIPIDTQYYLQNQLTLPLTRIFEPILSEENVKSLFSGEHTRKIKVSTPSIGGIMKFAVKKRTCIGCKVPLKDSESVVCQHCEKVEGQLYVKQVEKVREYEDLYSKVWTQCQRCQGSLHQDVLCTSNDCPIFYRRKKVQKDLNEAQAALDRFAF